MSRWPQRTDAERLWARVSVGAPDECWPWSGATYQQGYGCLKVRGRGRGTHVLALEIASGEAAAGRWALHSCDNPPCCNPAHLRWGTAADNSADMFERGRVSRVGTCNGRALLTPEQVLEIRRRRSLGETAVSIALDFPNMSLIRVRHVASGRGWAHLENRPPLEATQ